MKEKEPEFGEKQDFEISLPLFFELTVYIEFVEL